MRILSKDAKHNSYTLQVENLDDLWNLYNIIEQKDFIQSKTSREIKTEGVGRPSSRRVMIQAGIRVSKIYFDESSDRLRIHGIIEKAPEEYSIQGSHHTLTISPNDVLSIQKDRWFKHQLERLEKTLLPEISFILLSIDADEACLAILRSFKLEVKTMITSKLPGKKDVKSREAYLAKFFRKITMSLKAAYDTHECDILVVGPGFIKEHYKNFLKKNEAPLFTKVKAVRGVGSGGISGINEALRGGVLRDVLRKSRVAEEIEYVEEVLDRLGKSSGNVSYGVNTVKYDAASGAVETLLVSIEKLKSVKERNIVEEVIKDVENRGGRIMVISPDHEGGVKLSSLGGIAALLRYPRHI